MNRPAPYLSRAPGQWLCAEDWNSVQVSMRQDIAAHEHRERPLGAEAIDPSARLRLNTVELSETLRVSGRTLAERAQELVSAPKQAEIAPKLPRSGGEISGDLRVRGAGRIDGDLWLERPPTVGGVVRRLSGLGPLRVVEGPRGVLRGPVYTTSVTSDGSTRNFVSGQWTDADNPTVLDLSTEGLHLAQIVARVTTTPVNDLGGSASGSIERWTGGAWQAVGAGFGVGGQPYRPSADEAHRALLLPAGAHRLRVALGVTNCFAWAGLLVLLRPVEGA